MQGCASCDSSRWISSYAFLWVFIVILLFILIFASFWAYNRYHPRRDAVAPPRQ